MRDQGKLTDWDDDKGFGFVTPEQGGLRAFVHIRAFSYRTRRPRNGDLITYQLGWDAQGRARAQNVLFRNGSAMRRPIHHEPASGGGPKYFWAITGMLSVIALAVLGRLSWWVPLVYFSASTILFIVYAFDKSAAMNRRWRVVEDRLHLIALLGGWPGALVAQAMFHHKSKKAGFLAALFLIAIFNVAVLAAAVLELDRRFLDASFLDWLRG